MLQKEKRRISSLKEFSKKSATGFQSVYTEGKLILHSGFFRRLIRELNLKKVDADIIAVLHILPDAVPFAWALSTIADINTIVPKPKSINKIVLKHLGAFPIKELTRENARNVIGGIRKKTVFLDIGGYFSGVIDKLQKSVGKNFCGVVEDTENGLRRYEQRGINFPFISVARSPLKDNEDKMVGQSIAFSAEKILRQHCIIPNGFRVGVIGYGKIGRSVAHSFSQRFSQVYIYDQNNILLTHAVSEGYNILEHKTEILYESDAICLATGNISLSCKDYVVLKNGCWLFSVTSADDEIDTEWLDKNYKADRISKYVVKYSNRNHYFYLMNQGNAINFIDGAAVGDFILLVHAELLVAAYRLMTNSVEIDTHEIDQETRDKICQIWLSLFKP